MTTDYDYKAFILAIAISTLLGIVFFVWKSPHEKPTKRSVAIFVLGDIGRSPRMMYHAESFAMHDFETFLVGYGGSKPIPSLERLPHVHFHYLPEPPHALKSLPFIITAPLKIAHQIIVVLVELLLGISQPPEFILVQNPPSIPTLALVWLVARVRGSKVIIDWHNLGYTVLAMRLGIGHPLVKVAKWLEARFGRTAYAHLFVTKAMHDFLVKEWDIRGLKAVLYDRPPHHFHRASPQEVHELFIKLRPSLVHLKTLSKFLPHSSTPYSTPFTTTQSPTRSPSQTNIPLSSLPSTSSSIQINRHRASISTPPPPIFTSDPAVSIYKNTPSPALRSDRPALVVSSTSWTPDEDFGILIEALRAYEERACALASAHSRSTREATANEGRLPKVLVLLTGKGPLKNKYMAEIDQLQEGWEWVKCVSMWLEPEDYPTLLGSADLGICLHSSSSALDLPMKVVDMFGCGLPVCALYFACLNELVKDGKNGLIFGDAQQLADQLETLLTSFPSSPELLSLHATLKSSKHQSFPSLPVRQRTHSSHGADEESDDNQWEWGTWEENWVKVVKPLITDKTF